MTTNHHNDICVTGMGAVTRFGVNIDELWEKLKQPAEEAMPQDYSLAKFKPMPHISDRRMLKAISRVDAVGLSALELAVKDAGLEKGAYDPHKTGVYVGAPAASVYDNEPYLDAQRKAGNDLRMFGKTCMESRPTTLLLGLPNNVLCYGALVTDARGPNDNYTSADLSGLIALMNASKQIKRNRLECAVAGGFACHNDPVNSWMFHRLGISKPHGETPYKNRPFTGDQEGAVLGDGATFMTLEKRAGAEARGRTPLATICGAAMRCDATGPNEVDAHSDGLQRAIKAALEDAQLGTEDIGLIFASGFGLDRVDQLEAQAIRTMFDANKPPVACLSQHLGNLMEAGGLVEVAIAPKLVAEFPESLRPEKDGPLNAFRGAIDPQKPHFMILRTSAWGEYFCLIAKREQNG